MSPISKIESLIQSGKAAEGRRLLHDLLKEKVERSDRLAIARLCRRANLANEAIRLLSPYVRPSGKIDSPATPQETAEYAASLTYLGAGEEAQRLLSHVDKQRAPEALLFEAFALFPNWDYGKAIPILESYAAHPAIMPYQRLVGRVNLLAALVDQQIWDRAEPLASEIAEESSNGGHLLLYGNILELTSQIAIANSQWARSKKLLDAAEATLNKMGTIDHLFVEKWRAILELKMSEGKNVRPLRKIRMAALNRGHWETVRDCDRYEAIATRNTKLFDNVYFGSPFQAFRKSLLDAFGGSRKIAFTYDWKMGEKSKTGKKVIHFDASQGCVVGKKTGIKTGQSLHRVLLALTKDFYRPLRVASAHHTLYPDDYYNPITSPKKVYELVRRLRRELTRKRIPLEVVETQGSYTLTAKCPLVMTLSEPRFADNREVFLLQQLRDLQSETEFSISEAQKTLDLSRRTLQRLLQYGVECEFLSRAGQGTATRYHFKK